jgi:putative PIN family toxin of toxin-antitoxin system
MSYTVLNMNQIPHIVIDTNVLAAALRSNKGASFRLIELIGKNRLIPCISTAVVLEYEDVLCRSFHGKQYTQTDVRDFLDFIVKNSRCVPIYFRWRPFLSDINDECILELAVTAGAEAIITYNKKDFKEVTKQFGVSILDAREFLIQTGELK